VEVGLRAVQGQSNLGPSEAGLSEFANSSGPDSTSQIVQQGQFEQGWFVLHPSSCILLWSFTKKQLFLEGQHLQTRFLLLNRWMPQRNGWRAVFLRSLDFHIALLTTRSGDA
jgi:hypothetical protein